MNYRLESVKKRKLDNPIKRTFLIVLLLSLFSLSLLSAVTSLIYDQATGKLDGFNVRRVPDKSNPNDYKNSTEVWSSSEYIGRLAYVGPATTFAFKNDGLPAVGATNNRFYFTLNNKNPDPSTWREFFLVARAKGFFHDKVNGKYVEHDFSGVNTVIENCGGTYNLPFGAGSQTVGEGEQGFNGAGVSGKNTNGSHPYLYRYRVIWIDLTRVNTEECTWNAWYQTMSAGYYESRVSITTASGGMLMLNLGAEYIPMAWHEKPQINIFNVDKIYLTPIRFNEIQWRHTPQDGLEIATVRYISTVDKAKITISSDSAGNTASFFFKAKNSNATFPFNLAYQCTINPGNPPVAITPISKTFTTQRIVTPSPVDPDNEDIAHRLHRCDGQILLYVPPETVPAVADVYSSTIYVVVERD